jgi:hypothetical protein
MKYLQREIRYHGTEAENERSGDQKDCSYCKGHLEVPSRAITPPRKRCSVYLCEAASDNVGAARELSLERLDRSD